MEAQTEIGRITPDGVITEFQIPTPKGNPLDLTVGPDGNLWFTETILSAPFPGLPGKIARITPDGTITEFPAPSALDQPNLITAGPDGNLWFTAGDGVTGSSAYTDRIGRITPDGTITEFPTPAVNTDVSSIAAGPDGNLWFIEVTYTDAGNHVPQTGHIGRITPDGTITEFALPSNPGGTLPSLSTEITLGPGGLLWSSVGNSYLGGTIWQVDPGLQLKAQSLTITAEEDAAFSGPVASFTDTGPPGQASDYSATIRWGDGSAPSPGTVIADGHGGFLVSGAHIYSVRRVLPLHRHDRRPGSLPPHRQQRRHRFRPGGREPHQESRPAPVGPGPGFRHHHGRCLQRPGRELRGHRPGGSGTRLLGDDHLG